MLNKLKDPKIVTKKFAEKLQNILGKNLRSVFLYGSIAAGEFFPGKSNLNILVVLEKLDNSTLEILQKHNLFSKLRKVRSTPLFLTKKEILNSLDVFPIEFLEMKDKHILIHGENLFRNMKILKKDLRHQCERELRSKIILLRQGYLQNKKNSRFLLASSAVSVSILLRSILFLKKNKLPLKRGEVITQACKLFDLQPEPFLQALQVRNTRFFWSSKKALNIFNDYLSELYKLAKKINVF
jgi:predicted nucleotidyltransferase